MLSSVTSESATVTVEIGIITRLRPCVDASWRSVGRHPDPASDSSGGGDAKIAAQLHEQALAREDEQVKTQSKSKSRPRAGENHMSMTRLPVRANDELVLDAGPVRARSEAKVPRL